MGQPEPAIPLKGRGRGTHPSGIAASSYIPSLDGLRAASILIVLLSHAGASSLIPGGFGVTVFFFLSGFLITTLLTREHDRYGSIALRAFYLRRLVRLGPPLLACLLLASVAALLGLAGADLDPSTLVSQILFYYNYHSLLTGSDEWVNGLGILWSLSVEEHFYLIWPALFIAIGRRWIGLRHLTVLLVALLVWRSFRYFVLGSSEWSIYISTDTRFDSLLYGCVLALMHWHGVAGQVFPTGRSALALLLLSCVVLVGTFVHQGDAFRSTLRYSLQGLALMPVFHYAVTRPDAPVFRVLNWGWVRRIGVYSYTMYLIHFVIIQALVRNGLAMGSVPLILLSFTLSVAVAALVYEVVEKPFRPLRARLTGH